MFAIVDIETTGGFAAGNGITEIAIILHNGKEEEGRFSSLVNPGSVIPRAITALTGITNEMVADAPGFADLAPRIFELLMGRVFVAHHVNFDYSFVQQQLGACGYTIRLKKLCTVRLARKIFPGLPSYSLGNLCRALNIGIENRHRAEGDASATSILFNRMIEADKDKVLAGMTKGKNAEQYLPAHLPTEQLDALPPGPGVYYFEDAKKQVLYVGKAINLQKRVRSHFSNNDKGKRKQDLLRQIYHIRFTPCSSELMALIMESQEIRRLWPPFNRSQKKYHHKYGIYSFENQSGYLQLVIEKKRSHLKAVHTFNWMYEGQQFLKKVKDRIGELQLEPEEHNRVLQEAVTDLTKSYPSLVLVEKDYYKPSTYAVYILDRGAFYGMGYHTSPYDVGASLESWKEKINPSPDNDYIRGLLYQSASSGARISIPLVD